MTWLKSALIWFLLCATMLASTSASPTPDIEYSTAVDTRSGLVSLIQGVVGDNGYVCSGITPEHFRITERGVRPVRLILKPLQSNETLFAAAERLEAEGYALENIAELAAFFQYYPKEVVKHFGIFAVGKNSRWTDQSGSVRVPYACVRGDQRNFDLYPLGRRYNSRSFVLVSRR